MSLQVKGIMVACPTYALPQTLKIVVALAQEKNIDILLVAIVAN